MANPFISVIVPVYNVEKYLDRCMQSIVDQTYRNLEIILVNDGSSDGSGTLCDTWEQRDSRVRVIHLEQSGVSAARNTGVEAAQGDYIGFVDGDDFIDVDMYSSLYDLMIEHHADIGICAVADVYADHTDTPAVTEGVELITPHDALSDIFLNKTLMVGLPPRLYAASLLKAVPCPVGKTHEDAYIVVDLFSRAHTIVVDRTPRYFYWHNEGTITSAPSSRATSDNVEAWEHNRALVEKLYPDLMQDVLFRCYWAHFDMLDGMILAGQKKDEQWHATASYLKAHRDDIIVHSEVNEKRKLAVRVLCVSESLYRLLVHAQSLLVRYNR